MAASQGRVADRRRGGAEEGRRRGQAARHLLHRRPGSVDGEVRPQPLPPAGGLVLTIYDRPLGRDAKHRYRLPDGDDFGGLRTHAPHGQRSSLWLKEEEWKSLVPESPAKGQTHKV